MSGSTRPTAVPVLRALRPERGQAAVPPSTRHRPTTGGGWGRPACLRLGVKEVIVLEFREPGDRAHQQASVGVRAGVAVFDGVIEEGIDHHATANRGVLPGRRCPGPLPGRAWRRLRSRCDGIAWRRTVPPARTRGCEHLTGRGGRKPMDGGMTADPDAPVAARPRMPAFEEVCTMSGRCPDQRLEFAEAGNAGWAHFPHRSEFRWRRRVVDRRDTPSGPWIGP